MFLKVMAQISTTSFKLTDLRSTWVHQSLCQKNDCSQYRGTVASAIALQSKVTNLNTECQHDCHVEDRAL